MKLQLALSSSYNLYTDILRQRYYPGSAPSEVRSSFLTSQLVLGYEENDTDIFQDPVLLEKDLKDTKVSRTLSMSERAVDKLNRLAEEHHMTTSEVVRILLLSAITEEKTENNMSDSSSDNEALRIKIIKIQSLLEKITSDLASICKTLDIPLEEVENEKKE